MPPVFFGSYFHACVKMREVILIQLGGSVLIMSLILFVIFFAGQGAEDFIILDVDK